MASSLVAFTIRYAAAELGYGLTQENNVMTLLSWSSLNPWQGSWPLTTAIVPVACNQLRVTLGPKYVPNPRLDVSRLLVSSIGRGSFHKSSSRTLFVTWLSGAKAMDSLKFAAADSLVGSPPCTMSSLCLTTVASVSSLNIDNVSLYISLQRLPKRSSISYGKLWGEKGNSAGASWFPLINITESGYRLFR